MNSRSLSWLPTPRQPVCWVRWVLSSPYLALPLLVLWLWWDTLLSNVRRYFNGSGDTAFLALNAIFEEVDDYDFASERPMQSLVWWMNSSKQFCRYQMVFTFNFFRINQAQLNHSLQSSISHQAFVCSPKNWSVSEAHIAFIESSTCFWLRAISFFCTFFCFGVRIKTIIHSYLDRSVSIPFEGLIGTVIAVQWNRIAFANFLHRHLDFSRLRQGKQVYFLQIKQTLFRFDKFKKILI